MSQTLATESCYYIGLMSGTSMDGVDGVMAIFPPDFPVRKSVIVAASSVGIPAALRADLMTLQTSGRDEIEREALAANALVHVYAECVNKILTLSQIDRSRVRAIGVHGQTIRHQPALGYTRQVNNPALLAELVMIDVVADFRSRDIAAGGQGAPLTPAFHQAEFGIAGETQVVLNLGGIANISVLHADGRVCGFDTGPGNVLMDGWIFQHQIKAYDRDGAWAASGKLSAALLETLLGEPYFALPAPKSTGRDLFHPAWLASRLSSFPEVSAMDVQATLAVLTATSVAEAIKQHAPMSRSVNVCGGGANNIYLMKQLQKALTVRGITATLQTTAALGVPPNQVEALAFAWLALRFLHRLPGNLAAVTGAHGLRVLGALYPK